MNIFKPFLALFFLAGLLGAGYVGYRYYNLPDLERDTMSALRSMPPFYCQFTYTLFEGGGSGLIYHMNRSIRSIVTEAARPEKSTLNQLMDSTGDNYLWDEDLGIWKDLNGKVGLNISYADSLIKTRTSFASHCTPWWRPEASLFVLPEGLELLEL